VVSLSNPLRCIVRENTKRVVVNFLLFGAVPWIISVPRVVNSDDPNLGRDSGFFKLHLVKKKEAPSASA